MRFRGYSSWQCKIFLFVAVLFGVSGIRGVLGFCALNIPGPPGDCLTNDHVNEALDLALRQNVTLVSPKNFAELYSNVAEILEDTKHILIQRLGIRASDAFATFQFIDTMRTNILQLCPKTFLPGGFTCPESSYRRLDGYCMNSQHPNWGGAGQPFKRLLDHSYGYVASGFEPVTSRDMLFPLPEARLVSNAVHSSHFERHDSTINFLFLHFAQFLAYDISDAPSPADQGVAPRDFECCLQKEHKNCSPLKVPPGDPFYSKHQVTCLSFLRSRQALLDKCSLGSRPVMNAITPTIDGSAIYGNTYEENEKLRTQKNGRLKDHNPFTARGLNLKPVLPPRLEHPNYRCNRESPNIYCFIAGDYRIMTQPGLTSLNILFVRMHNWIADNLKRLNPHWDDAKLFNESRRIFGAILQHVTYNEFLPNLLNKQEMDSWNLWVSSTLYTSFGWDQDWNPQVSLPFADAAFRFAHSLVPEHMQLYSSSHAYSGFWRLRDTYMNPKYVLAPGMIDQIMHGAVNQPAEAMDASVNDELRNLLFKQPGVKYGHDLATLNIARGREHGLEGYLAYRRLCRLKPDIETWGDLLWVMPNETVTALQHVYRTPGEIDLWSGGVSERKPAEALVGPTFACLIAEQFANLKRGDQFWYENPDLPTSFTEDQLGAIKKMTMARILCDHLDNAHHMPKFAMILHHLTKNPLLPCNSNAILRFDFEPWRGSPSPFFKSQYKNETNSSSSEEAPSPSNSAMAAGGPQMYPTAMPRFLQIF